MSIRDHLRQGEAIISDHEPFYATSQRVIHYREMGEKTELRDIPFVRLTSVETVKEVRHKAMIAGTLMVIGGIIMMATVGLFTSPLAILGGIGALVYGMMGKESYYQFRAHEMTREEEAFWHMDYFGSGAFVTAVRNLIGERNDR